MIKLYKEPNQTERDLCNFARVSTGSEGTNDEGLIRNLLIWNHMSPFRHISMTFLCKNIPIYTMRQWTRHQVGGEFVPVFEEKDGSTMVEKSGRYTEMQDYKLNLDALTEDGKKEFYDYLDDSFERYNEWLSAGLLKEEARQVLPLCTTTSFYWTVNLDALMHFLSLRMDRHAQKDIRENAEKIFEIFQRNFPKVAKEWRWVDQFDKGMRKVYERHYEMFAGMTEEQIIKKVDELIFGSEK